MAAITIPQNQNLYPTPNEHIKFNFEDSIEEYRTARYLNNILKIFGPDTILWGLDLINITWTDTDEITLNFNNGTLIQDSTLIKMLYSFDKVLTDLSETIRNNYYVIVYTDFKFQPVTTQVTSDPQQFLIKIGIYDPINKEVYSTNLDSSNLVSWDTEKNRIILHCAPFTSPYDVINEIEIGSNTYTSRGAIKDPTTFDYDIVEAFNLDGGLI
jgi:hypothetical protein